MIFKGFLAIGSILLLVVLTSSNAVPIDTGSTGTCETGVDQLRLVAQGMDVMKRVALNSLCTGSIQECLNVEFPLGQKVLCYVYDRYMDYSHRLLTTPPDNSQFATYKANQYVAWKNLNSTCSWVQVKTNNSIPACTVTEIGKSCVNYRLYEHIFDVRSLLDNHIRMVNGERPVGCEEVGRPSIPSWLQSNLLPKPESTSSVILTATGCEENSVGDFTCM